MSEGLQKAPINYIWPFVGFGLGTAIVGSLVLSIDVRDRLIGGLIGGGIPFGLLGLWYALHRRKGLSN